MASICAEKALPGQEWPPPSTRYSSTSAPEGQSKRSRVTSSATGSSAGAGAQPLRTAQVAARSGTDGPAGAGAGACAGAVDVEASPSVPLPSGDGSEATDEPRPPVYGTNV